MSWARRVRPELQKQKYDPIVTRMSKSFRSGTGFQTPGKP
jgi:hypothetical protein